MVLDVVFWPFDLLLRAAESLWRRLVAMRAGPGKPAMSRATRQRTGVAVRLLILLPIMIFVLFPFFWVIITSLKTTPQISQRTSIFWPSPFTLDQYWSLLQRTPFLIWFRNSVIVAAISPSLAIAAAWAGPRRRQRPWRHQGTQGIGASSRKRIGGCGGAGAGIGAGSAIRLRREKNIGSSCSGPARLPDHSRPAAPSEGAIRPHIMEFARRPRIFPEEAPALRPILYNS